MDFRVRSITGLLAIYLSILPLCQAQAPPQKHADELAETARKLASEWSKAKTTEALNNYRKAFAIYQAAGDAPNQLRVLLEMGQAQEASGNPVAAKTSYERALNLSRQSRRQQAEAAALNRLGFFYIEHSDFEKALDYGEQARQTSLAIGDQRNEAEALLLLGAGNYHLRKTAVATDYLQQSQQIFTGINDSQGRGRVLEMMGHVSHESGKPREALQQFAEAFALANRAHNLLDKGKALNSLAITYSILGQKQNAVEHYRQALAIFEQMGHRRLEAVALNGLGFIYFTVAENQRSLNYYSRALKLFRSEGDRVGERIALARIAKLSEALRDQKTAAQAYEQLLLLTRQLKDPVFEAHVLNWLGDVYISSDARRALPYYEQALALSRQHGNQRAETYTLIRLGHSRALLGQHDSARDFFHRALERAQISWDRDAESLALYNLASLERAQNRMAQAQALIERSLKIVESLTADAGNRELRASYFATVHQQYEFYIDVLMHLHKQNPSAGFNSRALEASERSRARSLIEMLGESRGDIRQGADPQLLEQERNTRAKLNKAIQKRQAIFSRPHMRREVDESQQEIASLTTEFEQIAGEIRRRSPQYAALTQPASLNLPQIQELLDDETVLVEYSLGERRSFAWTVTREAMESFELPERAELEKLARVVYEGLTTNPDVTATLPRDYDAAVDSLSRILLEPLANYQAKKRVVVIASGILQYIPFSTLHFSGAGGKQRLLAQQEIVSLPSASALAVQRSTLKGRAPASRLLAVIADPVFEANDSRILKARSTRTSSPAPVVSRTAQARQGYRGWRRLLFSRQEADAVFRLIPPAEGMKVIDFEANRQTVAGGDLANFKMIHFATHGVMDNEFPQLSGIVLSMFDEQGRPQDGFFQLYEIYNLKLVADLVVLSACQTALGKDIKGEGIVGLTRGFMYAGAPRVVASLWNVDDAATAELMSRFYREMLVNGLRPAAALRVAQLELSKERRYESPYFWAGFVLQGEWK